MKSRLRIALLAVVAAVFAMCAPIIAAPLAQADVPDCSGAKGTTDCFMMLDSAVTGFLGVADTSAHAYLSYQGTAIAGSQNWYLQSQKDGNVKILNQATRQCLDVWRANELLDQWECNVGGSEEYTLEIVPGTTLVTFHLAPGQHYDGRDTCLGMAPAGNPGPRLLTCDGSAYQQWNVGSGGGWATALAVQNAVTVCAATPANCRYTDTTTYAARLGTERCVGAAYLNNSDVPETHGWTDSTTDGYSNAAGGSVTTWETFGAEFGFNASVTLQTAFNYTHTWTSGTGTSSSFNMTVPPHEYGWFTMSDLVRQASGDWTFNLGQTNQWTAHVDLTTSAKEGTDGLSSVVANHHAQTLPVAPQVCATNLPSAVSAAVVQSAAPGAVRSDFTGQAGMKFTTGPSGLHVTSLGRYRVTGNIRNHVLGLYRASDNALLAGSTLATATAPVDAAGFQYSMLSAAIDLPANTTYYLTSAETAGGDQSYGVTSRIQTTNGISAVGPISSADGRTWTDPGSGYANDSYGPMSMLATTNGPPVSGASTPTATSGVVTPVSKGVAVNNLTAQVGMRFTTGSAGQHVAALGRLKVPGNSGSHLLSVIRVSDNAIVASATVNTATAVADGAGFQFAALGSAVDLAANTTYSLVSAETSGGDQFYDNSSKVTAGNGITNVLPVYGSGGGWNVFGLANQSYGPVSLLATAAPVSSAGTGVVTSVSEGAAVNNLTAQVGMRFTTGPAGQHVTALGRLKVPGNTASHLVSIIRVSDNAIVASATVNTATAVADGVGFQFAALGSAVDLAANTTYSLVSAETSGGDQFYDNSSKVTAGNGITNVLPVYGSGGGWNVFGLANQSYGPVSFLSTAPAAAAPTVLFTPVSKGAAVNNVSAQLGMRFTTGPNGQHVAALGRMKAPGDTATHLVSLIRATDSVVIASANVNTATAPVDASGLQYATLTTAVDLDATTTYYLVSAETSGGDPLYDASSKVTAVSGLTGVMPVSGSGSTWNAQNAANQSYGPLGMLAAPPVQAVAGTAMVTSVTPGPSLATMTAQVGMRFTTGANGQHVTALGRYKVAGNTGSHVVSLVRADLSTLVSVTVNSATAAVGSTGFQYASLATAIDLSANTTYYLISAEAAGGDQFYGLGTTVTVGNGVTGVLPVMVQAGSWSTQGSAYANQSWGPVSILG